MVNLFAPKTINAWFCGDDKTAPPASSGATRDLQGDLAHKKQDTPLGPPQGPRHSPTVGSYGGDVSYERGSPVPRLLPNAIYVDTCSHQGNSLEQNDL